MLTSLACTLSRPPEQRPRASVARADDPSPDERYCAWFGEARNGVLYFGESAFWAAMLADGDPAADLALPGPQPIGRFDLRARRLLPSLEVGRPGDRSGVWDVLPGPDGVVFTTYFEEAGRVDPRTRDFERFDEAGLYLNELARGPGGLVVATRYADPEAGGGAIVLIDETGRTVRRLPLPDEGEAAIAPKTPAWDPIGDEYWVTTDVLPQPAPGADVHPHPLLIVDAEGVVRARYGAPGDATEYQFVRFTADGTGLLARVIGPDASGRSRLELLWLAKDARPRRPEAARPVLLDDRFERDFDFAQDIQPTDDGRAVVTQWSGLVHVVDARGAVRSTQLPKQDAWSLYYTAVLAGEDEVCATLCADVEVVCQPLPRGATQAPQRRREAVEKR